MAQHPALTTFLAQLDADVGAGTSTEFLTSTGRRLVAAHILAEKDFPKTGQPRFPLRDLHFVTIREYGRIADHATGHNSQVRPRPNV